MVWAALDCPGGWTLDIVGRPAVLGRITAQVDALPRVGEPCVVMGRLLRRSGRKGFSATTVYDGDGRVLGRAESVWIEIDPQKSDGAEPDRPICGGGRRRRVVPFSVHGKGGGRRMCIRGLVRWRSASHQR